MVGSSATIGTTTLLAGNILALTSITVATGANVDGRLLARNGTVTLQSNTVTACSGGPAPPVPPPAANFVPTLGPQALALLAIALAAVALLVLRRHL